MRHKEQQVGGERQDGGMCVEGEVETEQSGRHVAFAARPGGGGEKISQDAGEKGIDCACDAKDGADGGVEQKVEGRDERRLVEPDIAV